MTRPSRSPLPRLLASIAAACAPFLLGCASDVDSVPGAETGAAASSSSGGATGLMPPTLLEVTSFSLSLKVTWETKSPCDAVLGERKTALSEYVDAFEVPGSDTIYVDPEATEDQTYTYRLRCKSGDALSDYSNEKTGNPMKF